MTPETERDDGHLDVQIHEQPASISHDLVNYAVHDVRGATHTLQMFVSVLLSEQPGPLNSVQRDFVASIRSNALRLERLADDLGVILEDGGGFKVEPKPLDLLSLIEECRREISVVASHRGVRTELSICPDGNVEIVSDRIRMAQILMNLLDNAVRHASPGSAIQLALRHSKNRILLTVTNQTFERLPDDLKQWTAPYVRGSTARERSPHGVGLGLTVVSHLIRRLGGRVVMRGKGDRVTIGVVFPRFAPTRTGVNNSRDRCPTLQAGRNPVESE